jgi:hypothetical protein
MGGEGIVLKETASLYRPGLRSAAWLKLPSGMLRHPLWMRGEG